MGSNRLVWFLLVDGQGEPYNGTTASAVDIPSSYVIAKFRKRVKAEYDQHGDELTGIQPSRLQVYANKAAFEGNEEPLEEDAKIANYGGSKKEALLVVVPRKVNQLRIAKDFDEEWLTEIIKCSELPNLFSMVKKVSGPLPILIPIANPAGLFAHLDVLERPPVESIHQIFEENTAKHCPKVMERIKEIVFRKVVVSTTEDSFHAFWDNIIRDTMLLLFQRTGCSWDRTSNKGTSTMSYRPDFIFRLNNVCVFRGEEKKANDDQDVPRKELIDKLVWTYGQAPYLFGYSVCGLELRLHAILPSCMENEQNEQRRQFKKPRIPKCSTFQLGYFDLGIIGGRLNLFRSLVNISPYLVRIANMCPLRNRPEYICTDEKRIDFEEQDDMVIVKKTFPRESASLRINHLKLIYERMKQARVPNVDSLIGEGSNYVLLSPVGDCLSKDKKKDPKNEKELLQALESVLEALIVLHSIGWMHRDIRWPNVIKQVNSSKWFLIDFDDASKSPKENCPDEHMCPHEHPPEIFNAGSHTMAVDIWGVGYLILSCKFSPSETLFDFGQGLVHSEPDDRPTAEQVLIKIRDYLRLH